MAADEPLPPIVLPPQRLTNEWAKQTVPRSITQDVLERAIAAADERRVWDALVQAWMLGVRDAALELAAQLIEGGINVQMDLDIVFSDDDDEISLP